MPDTVIDGTVVTEMYFQDMMDGVNGCMQLGFIPDDTWYRFVNVNGKLKIRTWRVHESGPMKGSEYDIRVDDPKEFITAAPYMRQLMRGEQRKLLRRPNRPILSQPTSPGIIHSFS